MYKKYSSIHFVFSFSELMRKAFVYALTICFSLGIPHIISSHEKKHEEYKAQFTKHYHESLFKIADKGEFGIEILLNEKEHKIGENVIGIVIHDKNDEDVGGAKITVNILAAGKSIESAAIIDKGDGLYIIEGVNPQRDGRWELLIKVKKKSIEDRAVFIFPDVLRDSMPAGKYQK